MPLLACLLLPAAAGCGPRFDDGAALEKQGRFLKAAEKYRTFALRNPSDQSAPRALMAAAEIYSVKLGLCGESKPLLERLAREYPSFEMPADMFRRIFVCPDFFPAGRGTRWKYGDSQTLGKNATQLSEVTDHTARGAVIKSAFYAGDQVVSEMERAYRFSGTDFMERQDKTDTLILNYPLEAGKAWLARDTQGRIEFRVEETGLKVKVGAGEFSNCVKIRRQPVGLPSWIYEYYAPWTGKILTSVAGEGFENRVTELLSYEEKK